MSKILANFHQDKEAWLRERAKGITASDAAAILGLSKFKTPFQVWAEKTKVLDNDIQETERMKWGSRLESGIALGFGEDKGLKVKQCGDLIAHPVHDWLMATPDFYTSDGGLLEVKNTTDYHAWKDGNIADHAHVQVVVQLLCTELEFAYIAALINGSKLEQRMIYRDAQLEDVILAQLAEFKGLIDSRTPPALQAEDIETVSNLYAHADPVIQDIELDNAWIPKIERFLELKDKKKAISDEFDLVKAEIMNAMGSRSKGKCGPYKVSWNEIKTNRLDAEMFKSSRPELYQQFCVPSSYRRFSVSNLTTKKEKK